MSLPLFSSTLAPPMILSTSFPLKWWRAIDSRLLDVLDTQTEYTPDRNLFRELEEDRTLLSRGEAPVDAAQRVVEG